MMTSAPAAAWMDSRADAVPEFAPTVDISVSSRFHAFDLAHEMSERRMLRTLHTGYPAFLVASRFSVPRRSVQSVWTGEPLNRALTHLHRTGVTGRPDAFICQRHDRIVASRLKPGADVFIGWSGQCRMSLAAARRFGMTTIVERGSTHIEWQRHLLEEEARATRLRVDVPDDATVGQELAEYSAADYIAVPSAFAASTFISRGVPASKLLVNPYGVDLRLFARHAAVNHDRTPHDGSLRVLHVGQVSARKGVHYLVDAVARVPGAVVTLVGAAEPTVAARIAQSRSARIAGPVAGRELPRWYENADVFCLLSIEEGLALVIAQAMAMGLPVIATPNTGAEELIDDGVTGFIVPARNSAAAADRLQLLADNRRLRDDMGQRARARVADGFGWSHYGERARASYARIVAH